MTAQEEVTLTQQASKTRLLKLDVVVRTGPGGAQAMARTAGLRWVQQSAFPQSWAFHAEVKADGSVDRLLRMDHQDHGEVQKPALTLLEDQEAFAHQGIECAREGGNCTCNGVVLYGRAEGPWQELRVETSVSCTAAVFDSTEAPFAKGNVCRCFSLSWLGAQWP
eukprot:Skav221282  [mRNA]  locus=scaffold2775:188192:196797:+ [translate_table: standard]